MTCKDCVHVDVCEEYGEVFSLIKGGKCSLFKDRSRFVELPCKSGDEVFYFDTAGQIYTSKITQFIYGTTGLLLDSDVMFESSLIGKRFFFTREAAEQALKERGENEK